MASIAEDNRTVIYDSRYGVLKVIYPAYYVSQVYVNDQEKPVNAYTGQALLYLPPGELEIRAPEGFKVDGPSRISLATNQTITTTLKKVQGTEYSVLTEGTIPAEIRNADNFLAVKSNGTIRIFDINEKKLVSSPIDTDPAAFDINAAGLLATIGSDGVKRGYTPDGELIWQTTGRLAGNEPVCLAFRADGIRFAAAGGRRLQFIESQTGKLIWERRLDYTIQALDVREDIVIAAAERMVYSFSTADGTLMPSAIPIQPAEIHSIQLTPRQVFAATSQGMVFLGNSTGRIIQTIPGETSRARLSPAGRYVAGLTTRGVELQDMETETRRKTTIEGGISGFSLSDKNLILFDAALKEGGAAVRFFRLGSRIEEYQRLYIFSDDTWVIGPVPMDGSYSHSEGGENHVKTVTKN
jgi:hypothetical protein